MNYLGSPAQSNPSTEHFDRLARWSGETRLDRTTYPSVSLGFCAFYPDPPVSEPFRVGRAAKGGISLHF